MYHADSRPETPQETEIRKWHEWVKRIENLIRLQAPRPVISHFVIRVFFPAMLRRMKLLPDVGRELGHLIAGILCERYGVCVVCEKELVATNDNCCPKCRDESDAIAKSVGLPEDDEELQ